MKKSKFLTLATSLAIVATSAVTYSVWDDYTAESIGTATVTSDITNVTADATFTLNETLESDSAIYEGTVTFNIDRNLDDLQLELTPTVTFNNVAKTLGTDYSISVDEVNGTGLTGTTDATLAAVNEYKYKVTVLNKDLAGSELKIKVAAEASTIQP